MLNYLLEKYSRKLKQVFYLKPVFQDFKADLSLKKELFISDLQLMVIQMLAARGPWYLKTVKPEERGILNLYRRPLVTATVAPSGVCEDMGLPGSVVLVFLEPPYFNRKMFDILTDPC